MCDDDHLAALCAQAGLVDVIATPQHEVSRRLDPDFQTRLGLWAEVAATRGHQMVFDGAITESERAAAEADYRAWLLNDAAAQSLYPIAGEGARPLSHPGSASQRS